MGRCRRTPLLLPLAGKPEERAAVDHGGARRPWPGWRTTMAAMESRLLHTSRTRREQSKATGPGEESLLCRCCSLSVVMSDENLRGGGRSLLVRKHAASPGTEKRETFYRFLRQGQLGWYLIDRPCMLLLRPIGEIVCARAARAEVRGAWSFTRGALVRHPAVMASHEPHQGA